MISKLAGVVGIEPTLAVLETAVLPLNDTPKKPKLFFGFFVNCAFLTPLAKLPQFDLALHAFAILTAPIVDPLAILASQFD